MFAQTIVTNGKSHMLSRIFHLVKDTSFCLKTDTKLEVIREKARNYIRKAYTRYVNHFVNHYNSKLVINSRKLKLYLGMGSIIISLKTPTVKDCISSTLRPWVLD